MKCPHCGNNMLFLEYERLVLTKETGIITILHMNGVPYRIEEMENPHFEPREEPYDESYKCPWCEKEIARDEETIKKMMRDEQ